MEAEVSAGPSPARAARSHLFIILSFHSVRLCSVTHRQIDFARVGATPLCKVRPCHCSVSFLSLFFSCSSSFCHLAPMRWGVGRKWSRWQPLMYLPQTVMNSSRENKPISSSRIGLLFLLPFPDISYQASCSWLSSRGLHLFSHVGLQGAPPLPRTRPNDPTSPFSSFPLAPRHHSLLHSSIHHTE